MSGLRYRLVAALTAATLSLCAACADDDSPASGGGTTNDGTANNGGRNNGTANNGTANDGATNDGVSSLPTITPDCFEPWSTEPIFVAGDLLDEALWNDPSVLREDDGTYVMYISASIGLSDILVEIYRLESEDGYHWELAPAAPVLSPVAPSRGVETPAVVKFGGRHHLFYTTYPAESDPGTFTIGHAVSDDGIAFEVLSSEVVKPSGDPNRFDGIIVGEPGPVVVGDTLHLYFTAVGVDAAIGNSSQVVGLVTSQDGESFSAPEKVLELDRERYPRADGWVGLSTPSAVVVGDRVHVFTDVANDGVDPIYGQGWLQVALFHAASDDGRAGWERDETFIHTREDFPWTARELRSVTPLLDGDRLRLWFAGDQLYVPDTNGMPIWHTDRWGIGTSECGP